MGKSLKALRDYAVQAAERAGLAKNRVEALKMAVDEYATNIITYGYHDAGLSGDIYADAVLSDDLSGVFADRYCGSLTIQPHDQTRLILKTRWKSAVSAGMGLCWCAKAWTNGATSGREIATAITLC